VKESWQKLQDEPYANSFGKLLTKLQETPDYQNIQIRPLLKQRVITILERVLEDQELRGHCFSLAEEALTSCHDNVSLGLNNLEMAVIARRAGKGEFNEEQLLQLGRGMFRMEVLRLIAQNKMDSLRTVDNVDDVDDVEVILAYQVGLRESLDLPVQTQEMLFRRISGVTDEDLATARELVLAAEQGKELPEFLAKENLVLLEFLAGWSPWQQQLEREYSSRFEGIIERFSDRESELGRRVKSQEIDEGAYVQELNQMPKELEQSRLALCKELTKEKLAGGL
jgi:hypothetical protein